MQTTCNESKRPDPHEPPNESTGTYKIVKSYRIKNADGTYTDKGTYEKTDSASKIKIESELKADGSGYKLKAWKTSTTYKPARDIDSRQWESQVPEIIKRNGTATGVITMASPETTLYLLLEKQDTASQTTCDEDKIPDPHDPPNESTGTFKIVKSYRTFKADGTYQDDGTFKKDNSSANITIEDELKADGSGYKLKAWKTSTTYTTAIDSRQWETQVPSTIKRNGTATDTITMASPETTLYLLLEKQETPPPPSPVADADYVLSESTIARKIALSAPDTATPSWGFNILDKVFQWKSPGIHQGLVYFLFKHLIIFMKVDNESISAIQYMKTGIQ